MNVERDNCRHDPIEEEAHRINRMLADDCFKQAGQALREDARELLDPRAFHYLIERVTDLSRRRQSGDHIVQRRGGGLYIEDPRGCLYGTGLDEYGRSLRQPDRTCPREPAWRQDRGAVDRRCDPGIDRGIVARFPRFDIRIDPGINRGFDQRHDSRFQLRREFRFVLPDARDLTRNLPDPRDAVRTIPLPRFDRLPDPRDVIRTIPLPRVDRLPNPRDAVGNLPRPGHGLPSARDFLTAFPLPGRSPADGRQHILIDPISRPPLPERR